MSIRLLAVAAALACVPALHAQDLTLQPGVLVPAVDTMYTVSSAEGGGDTIAVSLQTLRRVTANGEQMWELEYLHQGREGSMADTTRFDPETLLPREQRRAGMFRRIDVRFGGARVHLRRGASRGEPADTVAITLEHRVFAGSMMDLLYRALPLAEGAQARIPFFIPERAEVHWADVRVAGVGAVQTREGPVQAWRVEARMGTGAADVFWIDRQTRVLLRIDDREGWSTIR